MGTCETYCPLLSSMVQCDSPGRKRFGYKEHLLYLLSILKEQPIRDLDSVLAYLVLNLLTYISSSRRLHTVYHPPPLALMGML